LLPAHPARFNEHMAAPLDGWFPAA
jgi:hypothetical protein